MTHEELLVKAETLLLPRGNLETTASGAPTPQQVLAAAGFALAFYAHNNPKYGDSWCKRGAQGAFHNVARKFDRLEVQTLTGSGSAPQEWNELVDLAAYAVMQLAWHLANRPEEARAYFERENPFKSL